MYEKEIEVKMRELPEDLRREVLDYMELLLKKHKGKETDAKKFKFDWEGVLSEIRGEITSVELQHRALELNVRKSMNLDFDDAYQYSMAKYYRLKVVTIDKDFERIKDVEILFL